MLSYAEDIISPLYGKWTVESYSIAGFSEIDLYVTAISIHHDITVGRQRLSLFVDIVWKMEKIVIFIGLIMSIYWFMLHGLTVPAHDYI